MRFLEEVREMFHDIELPHSFLSQHDSPNQDGLAGVSQMRAAVKVVLRVYVFSMRLNNYQLKYIW